MPIFRIPVAIALTSMFGRHNSKALAERASKSLPVGPSRSPLQHTLRTCALNLENGPSRLLAFCRGVGWCVIAIPTVQRCRNFWGSTAAWLFLESSGAQWLGRP